MPQLSIVKLTVREQIILAIKDLLVAAKDDNGNRLFETIIRGNLDGLRGVVLPAAGIEDSEEEVLDRFHPFIDKTLPLLIEFRFPRQKGLDPWSVFNYYLGQLQTVLLQTHQIGPSDACSFDVQEVSNTPSIEAHNDPAPSGVIMIEVKYRHRNGNPYTQE